jgi:hypothetical protein
MNSLKEVTLKQWLQFIILAISGLITGATFLVTLIGPDATLKLIAGFNMINIIVSAFGSATATQTAQVNDVLAMKGIENIDVNANASKALATLATDPMLPKIGAAPGAQAALVAKAQGDV